MSCTPLKTVTCEVIESPKCNTATVKIPVKVLRKLDPNDEFLIDKINDNLKYVQLLPSERLKSRISSEVYRCSVEYRKLRNGYRKAQMDKNVKSISIQENEIKHTVVATPIQPKHLIPQGVANTGHVHIDNSSSKNKHRVVRRLEKSSEKVLDFVETYGVIPKKVSL